MKPFVSVALVSVLLAPAAAAAALADAAQLGGLNDVFDRGDGDDERPTDPERPARAGLGDSSPAPDAPSTPPPPDPAEAGSSEYLRMLDGHLDELKRQYRDRAERRRARRVMRFNGRAEAFNRRWHRVGDLVDRLNSGNAEEVLPELRRAAALPSGGGLDPPNPPDPPNDLTGDDLIPPSERVGTLADRLSDAGATPALPDGLRRRLADSMRREFGEMQARHRSARQELDALSDVPEVMGVLDEASEGLRRARERLESSDPAAEEEAGLRREVYRRAVERLAERQRRALAKEREGRSTDRAGPLVAAMDAVDFRLHGSGAGEAAAVPIVSDFSESAERWTLVGNGRRDAFEPERVHEPGDADGNYFLRADDANQRASGLALDLVFAIDRTGSMGEEIDEVVEQAQRITERLNEDVGDLRLGLVWFGDEDAPTPAGGVRLSADLDRQFEQLDAWGADFGGGGYAEYHLAGIDYALNNAGWRSRSDEGRPIGRAIVVISDASMQVDGSGRDFAGRSVASVAELAERRGTTVSIVVAPGGDAADVRTLRDQGRRMASTTHGRFVELGGVDGLVDALTDIAQTSADQASARYFVAPPKFLGDLRAHYGTTLEFELRSTSTDFDFEAADLVIEGPDGRLAFRGPLEPGKAEERTGDGWRRYAVTLDERAGWRRELDAEGQGDAGDDDASFGSYTLAGDGEQNGQDGQAEAGGSAAPLDRTPTRREFLAVLADVASVKIRAEYYGGEDTLDLDNVVLGGRREGMHAARRHILGNLHDWASRIDALRDGFGSASAIAARMREAGVEQRAAQTASGRLHEVLTRDGLRDLWLERTRRHVARLSDALRYRTPPGADGPEAVRRLGRTLHRVHDEWARATKLLSGMRFEKRMSLPRLYVDWLKRDDKDEAVERRAMAIEERNLSEARRALSRIDERLERLPPD